MTSLGKLVRTTAFKLSVVYLLVFALFAAGLLAYLAWNTQRLITDAITETVNDEIANLEDELRLGGIQRLLITVDGRARRPGSSLYLVTTALGDGLVGNVDSVPGAAMRQSGWREIRYRRPDDETGREYSALVRVVSLQGGYRLLVGRDLEDRDRLLSILANAARWSVAFVMVLGLAGGFFVTRRVLRRVDAMTDTSRTIMAGDLSGRLPVSGTGDELDRLAGNLNAMLERIEALMHGMKEVSDNIAHDLKTPLTRLRNRAEAALRSAHSEDEYRAALDKMIEESDSLIRIFNALLMIARAEAGQARDDMIELDAAEIARGVGELYEPLAEDKGLQLQVDAAEPVPIRGNRELIGQALANLVDNAIKYAPEAGANDRRAIAVHAARLEGRAVLSVADRGPGIAEADRARAVQRFVRLESSRGERGFGLGLSLASAVARLHGGELRLEDNGPGLRASLVLPLAA